MRFNGTTIPTHRDETYDTSEVSRYGSSGSGGIDVESLNVTENGTYIAPDGKAYSPVNVNVDGGGSSDFSTAEVTFKNLPNRNPYSLLALYVDTEHNCINSADLYVSIEESVTVPLYKNKAVLGLGTLSGVDYSVMPTAEGNVTINMNEKTLEITGEGAFTCAGVSRD